MKPPIQYRPGQNGGVGSGVQGTEVPVVGSAAREATTDELASPEAALEKIRKANRERQRRWRARKKTEGGEN